MPRNFIPGSDALFDIWQSNLITKMTASATRFNIPAAVVTDIVTKQVRWNTAYAAAKDPATRTKITVKEKQQARDDYEDSLRALTRSYLTYNPAVTDSDRENLELPIHKTTHTPAPVATEPPWLKPNTSLLRHVSFDYGGSELSKTKPTGQHGLELIWEIAKERPPHVRNLTHSVFDTHTPLVIEFDEEDRGNTLWYTARWENTRGEKGPWGEIVSVIIP
ncbi:MAG: hypothetical protein LBD91_01145 [Prevotellaceae bacterium]|jgi:hypothetical protein|nr:hypothetical protein [Prevotellaceae bacterium]